MNRLMLSCRKATELMEKENFIGLKRIEKIQLFMHTRMCDACTHYYKQSQFIDKALQYDSSPELNAKNITHKTLSSEIKSKIINNLEKK